MTSSLSANALTAMLLAEIPKRFPGSRCWRSNVGAALPLAAVRTAISHLRTEQIQKAIDVLSSRPVHFGVKGQADISGIILSSRESPPFAGMACVRPAGIRLEVEIKCGADKMREEQEAFRAMILRAGGIHVIARDLEQAIKDIEGQL